MKKYLEFKEIQKEELKILKEMIKFLDKNNTKYYISYGTLLGAVRHGGFIPWDDDIDLMMFRKDYDKLLKILKQNNEKINNELEAIAFELGNSDWPFVKIVNKNIFVEEKENCDKNLWIDIFPLDETSNKYTLNFKKMLFMRKIYDIKRYDVKKFKYKNNKKIINIIRNFAIILLKPFKYETIINKFINSCKNVSKESNLVSDIIWNNSNTKYKKEWFKDKKFKFENLEVNGIKEYDEYLKEEYGEYMKLPAEEDRISHNIKAYIEE